MSTTPRWDSLAVSMVPILRASAFFFSSSLVMSVTARSACMACWLWARPSASTIWFFHRGMVLTMVDWIFSAIMELLFCKSRIWGPICKLMVRVSSRS